MPLLLLTTITTTTTTTWAITISQCHPEDLTAKVWLINYNITDVLHNSHVTQYSHNA